VYLSMPMRLGEEVYGRCRKGVSTPSRRVGIVFDVPSRKMSRSARLREDIRGMSFLSSTPLIT
jgi:hypothetical protein